ncbi:hypothetical protein J6590_007990 [Homalodisca vitripennis]|nr:hypothetical protein J6590_007990 [Homalodisca vitripennis]
MLSYATGITDRFLIDCEDPVPRVTVTADVTDVGNFRRQRNRMEREICTSLNRSPRGRSRRDSIKSDPFHYHHDDILCMILPPG